MTRKPAPAPADDRGAPADDRGAPADDRGAPADDRGAPAEPLPPDPEAYDSPRAAAARARGLSAPYIAGGRDPDPGAGNREERFYLRLLIAMVAVIVLGGFVLGIIATIFNITGLT